MLYYSMLFKISEKAVSAPFRFSNLLFPSVTHILIDEIVILLTGLNVTRRGSKVKLYDGFSTLVLKL